MKAKDFISNIKDTLEVMDDNGRFHRKIMEKAIKLLEQFQIDNKKLKETLQIIQLNIKAGAVTTQWIETFITNRL